MDLQQEISAYISELQICIDGLSSFSEKVEFIRRKLFDSFLSNYVRDQALLSNLIKGAGGNCEAQTKCVTSIMSALRLELPSNTVFGIQCFSDHIQPVLFCSAPRTVTELVSGKLLNVVLAPIYASAYFAYIYLRRKGKTPAVSLAQLLLAESDVLGENSQNDYSTNSSLRYLGGAGTYNQGPVPEQANLQYQPFKSPGVAGFSGKTHVRKPPTRRVQTMAW